MKSSDGTERSECTDKACTGEAKYALWMGDQFSRVVDAHPAMSYDDGDLHPHVCETCLPRYERLHGDKGEFVRPVEKLAADGGTDRPDPAEDPRACSLCGTHIGFSGDEYCDGCAREIGVKPPMRRCVHCGQRGPEEQMEAIDVSAEDEYYPTFEYLCRSCSGGESA